MIDKMKKFGERIHPDSWYEDENSNKEPILYCVCGLDSKYCGHIKETVDEKKSRHIPKAVQREVWRRDYGRCVECGSKERLEYDHIIPFSRGGSNTARNIQLLCEKCNRKKHDKI